MTIMDNKYGKNVFVTGASYMWVPPELEEEFINNNVPQEAPEDETDVNEASISTCKLYPPLYTEITKGFGSS